MTAAGATAVTGIALGAAAVGSNAVAQLLNSRAAGPWLERLIGLGVISWGVGITSTLAYLALLQRRTDVDTGFWARVWRGPIGRLAFAIARRAGGARPAAAAMTHRATELSLGLATEQLYESLPRDTRLALGDLPAVVRRLQDDAQALRRRHEQLQEALSGAEATTPEFDDLRAMKEQMHARLGEAVGTLESLRLGLLRLHAGSITVDGLTTHVDLAAEVSAQVARLVSARDEVEGVLRFPREVAPTPA
jgi:hypothetical protein